MDSDSNRPRALVMVCRSGYRISSAAMEGISWSTWNRKESPAWAPTTPPEAGGYIPGGVGIRNDIGDGVHADQGVPCEGEGAVAGAGHRQQGNAAGNHASSPKRPLAGATHRYQTEFPPRSAVR